MSSNMIKGKASWAHLTTPNTKWEEDRYEISLEVDADTYNKYSAMVNTGHSYKDGKYMIRFNSPAKKNDGTPEARPILVDADARPSNANVGNGSEVFVKFRTFTYTRGRAQGKTRSYLEGVQIINLVEYTPEGDGDGATGTIGFSPIEAASPHAH